ncbi:hypothetical protein [Streptomyces albidoflavus]|uniref:hypothetical protein n=1 Tax=Streptomyces albidoflavus TaxID=1886 RepID=UPI0033C1B027
MATQPSKPWRVSVNRAGKVRSTYHFTERSAYLRVGRLQQEIGLGNWSIRRISIHSWYDHKWTPYEDHLEQF